MTAALTLSPGRNSRAATAGFSVAGFSRSPGGFSGDYCEVIPAASGALSVVIADVMGTGKRSALFADRFRTEVHRAAERAQEPAELLDQVNRSLFFELSRADVFITAQVARLEPGSGWLSLASAGHCPMLLHRGTVEAVAAEGLPLGIEPFAAYEEHRVSLDPVACLLFYTDGVTEARNRAQESFGERRLEEWLARSAGRRARAEVLTSDLRNRLDDFQSGLAPTDDQTFLILASAGRGYGPAILCRRNAIYRDARGFRPGLRLFPAARRSCARAVDKV